jgi:hypothetical protein
MVGRFVFMHKVNVSLADQENFLRARGVGSSVVQASGLLAALVAGRTVIAVTVPGEPLCLITNSMGLGD